MAIVIRFVDKDGFVRERFFGVVHVPDTTTLTLKDEIYTILSHHSLDIQDIRGRGYDCASNMRGEWNGLKALVSNDCPYAYYIHCFAHRLQLPLMAASKEVILVQSFFNRLSSIVNVVGASCKRTEQLKKAYVDQIAYFVEIGELEGRGLNQINTLQRVGDTRWGSHLRSISSLITDALCQALQCQSQDILNAMNFVSSTKALIQKFRDEEWDNLLTTVKSFCEARDIDVLDMNARYVKRGVELLNLSSALDPKEARESFRSIDILLLVSKFYSKDFTNQEMTLSKTEVDHYKHNVVRHPDFKKVSISTATTERAFSAMNIIKNKLCNKMEDDFLMDSMILYIE
ncbi:zinc finger MYM-type protein 1-like [Quercus lobata]|uniref:zinc finger MYM-type protein 1-like n=1 Tax=Quercus lobata TaxID=97700 RepID=UPI0012492F91|nr:zinc finger MYM-type protein 1-like [Quercus lobata]